jgi:Reverse transcriptase (RNA-dependent DNA polymerase)
MRWGDRQGVGGESPHDEGVANCIEPEPCGFVRQGRSEASVAAHSSAIEPRKAFVLDADAVDRAEADAGGRVIARARLVRCGRRTWHVRKLSVFRESRRAASPPRRSVSGRRGAIADDERTREVTIRHSSKKREDGEVHRAPTHHLDSLEESAQARGPAFAGSPGSVSAAAEPAGLYSPRRKTKSSEEQLRRVLNAIYEEDFLGFSYGFRSGRGQHDAMDALVVGIRSKRVSWILDADIETFFDTVNQQRLMPFVEHRVGDKRIHRLIQKWLKTGILETIS